MSSYIENLSEDMRCRKLTRIARVQQRRQSDEGEDDHHGDLDLVSG